MTDNQLYSASRKPQTAAISALTKGLLGLWLVSATTTSFAKDYREVVDAPVLEVIPIVETVVRRIPHETCHNERVKVIERSRPSGATTLAGALLGGAVANVAGRNSSHRGIITGVGAAAGAVIGNEARKRRQHDHVYYSTEEVCNLDVELREEERISGYQVHYQVGDNVYQTNREHRPGATIPVRFSIVPLP